MERPDGDWANNPAVCSRCLCCPGGYVHSCAIACAVILEGSPANRLVWAQGIEFITSCVAPDFRQRSRNGTIVGRLLHGRSILSSAAWSLSKFLGTEATREAS